MTEFEAESSQCAVFTAVLLCFYRHLLEVQDAELIEMFYSKYF